MNKNLNYNAQIACFGKFISQYSQKGVVHVGANDGGERHLYNRLDKKVLWIEPDPDTYKALESNIRRLPKQKAVRALILDEEKEVKFNVSRQSARSSVYDFTEHHFKDTGFKHTKTLTLLSSRLDSMDLDNYDALITDTQGADLNAIKSSGEKLINFNLIICEVFFEETYKNISLAPEYDEYLNQKGFKRIGSCGDWSSTANYVYVRKKK